MGHYTPHGGIIALGCNGIFSALVLKYTNLKPDIMWIASRGCCHIYNFPLKLKTVWLVLLVAVNIILMAWIKLDCNYCVTYIQ